MLLSQLLQRIDEAAERLGSLTVAIGAVNGRWRSFSGIELSALDGEAVALLSAGETAYFRTETSSSEFRGRIHDFIQDHGDMQAAVSEGGMTHAFMDLNVDQDVGNDGSDVNVMIVQAYVVKSSPRGPGL